ncbi:T cell receptor beta chain MC.7.G5-like isoform 6-T6 [Pholidichthys leucotaenia]
MMCPLIFCFLSGVCLGLEVHQSPSNIIRQPDENMHIFCTHTKTDYYMMLWYQQASGDTAMKLIGYLYHKEATGEEPYKDDFQIVGDLSGNTEKNASLKVNRVKQAHTAVYYCAANHCDNANEAHFGKGTKLTVLEKDRSVTPPTVKVIRPSPRECTNQKDKGKKKTIVCVASGFYPDHVSVLWKIDGENVTNNVATDEDAKMVGDFYRITSRLRVSREDYYSNPKKEFTCEVSFFNKTHTTYHSDGISSDEDKQTVTMTREKYLSITQSAKLSYGVLIVKSCVYGAFVCFLVWKLQGSGKPIK